MSTEDWVLDDDDQGVECKYCKYCGDGPLFWEEARGERNQKVWVLVDEDGDVHDCPKRPGPATADEFDDV